MINVNFSRAMSHGIHCECKYVPRDITSDLCKILSWIWNSNWIIIWSFVNPTSITSLVRMNLYFHPFVESLISPHMQVYIFLSTPTLQKPQNFPRSWGSLLYQAKISAARRDVSKISVYDFGSFFHHSQSLSASYQGRAAVALLLFFPSLCEHCFQGCKFTLNLASQAIIMLF